MDDSRQSGQSTISLPAHARVSINHCNLPAFLLGSLTFQQHPVPLYLDGVEELHKDLFSSLEKISDSHIRAENFQDYMKSAFLLDHLDEAGFNLASRRARRNKADYLRMLRGWLFDPDSKEGAVMKGWVESRFGLRTLNHRGPLRDTLSERYMAYLNASTSGLYNANALESQLDLLFAYCQYEIRRQYPSQLHLRLYRGINRIEEHELLKQPNKRHYILLLNNLNSFTSDRERADEFGDYILEALIPLAKLLYIPGLLPNSLKGEDEYLVIGGVHQIQLSSF